MASVERSEWSRWAVPALVLEALAVAGLVVVFTGDRGASSAHSALAGGLLMASLGIPGALLAVWGRGRSNAAFMGAVIGTILVKFLVVGLSVAWLVYRTELPPLEFAAGLVTGWLASFGLLALAVRPRAGERAVAGRA